MEPFVNRKNELQLIYDSFDVLIDKKRLLRTPIIEIQGVGGIGKTSLLRQIEQRCYDTKLSHIWIDISQIPLSVSDEIVAQIMKYTKEDEKYVEDSPVHAAKILLEQGPVVMLFDSVDTASIEQLNMIETILRDLIDDERLFVILASKKALSFQQERSVARKLKTLFLKPLDQENCRSYLEHLGNPVEPEVRDLIFQWTRGYPLAMHVMAQAITQGVDPRTEQGQKDMLSLLTDQVINQEVLAKVKPEERAYYQAALQLFAVPRRFNLVIMQDLIEMFAPNMKRENSLAYFSLPKTINEATDVLNWSMPRAGFSVDEPIRTLFLLLLKIEQPEHYFSIHEFLAQTNLDLAKKVPGSDRVRYIRECLYHVANNRDSAHISELLAQAMQIILDEPPGTFLQFSEEFSQDEELKEALGSHLTTIQSQISGYQPKNNTHTLEGWP